jgi:hypothetical protein
MGRELFADRCPHESGVALAGIAAMPISTME